MRRFITRRSRNVDNLVAIRIDCRDRAHISISHVISPPLGHAYTLRGGFFINAEVLGLCTHSHVFSWSMNVSDAVQRAPQDVYRPVSFEN
jgi:hypothetical protein